MTNRIDQLGDRARWFLENFDEIDLADICASHEAAAAKAQEAIARVQHLADLIAAGAPWTRNHTDLARRIRDALQPPAPDGGPSVAEAKADDVRWPLEKAGE